MIDYSEKLHIGNESYEPTRTYCMYITIDKETFKIDNQALDRARRLLKHRPYTISRVCCGDYSSGLEFYRKYLRADV